MQSWLIIGIGNTLRRDDGAGWLLADRLATLLRATGCAVQIAHVQQLTPEIAEEIAESPASAIIFADVAAGSVAPQILQIVPAANIPQTNSHRLTPAVLLLLAEKLYGRQLPAFLATVPGVDFEHGEGLSPLAEAGVEEAALTVSTFVKQMQGTGSRE